MCRPLPATAHGVCLLLWQTLMCRSSKMPDTMTALFCFFAVAFRCKRPLFLPMVRLTFDGFDVHARPSPIPSATPLGD